MRATLPARLGTGLRWLAMLATVLVTAEVATRADEWVTWRAPLLGEYSEARLMIRDSLGFRGRPGYRFEKWGMNNEGFRGPDITLDPAPGRIRVAILGASETFGLYESEGLEYPARTQQLLDSIAPGRFEIINVALPGMTLPSMVPYYEHAVARLHPRLVLVYPTPSFYLDVTPPRADFPSPGSMNAPARAAQRSEVAPVVFRPRLRKKARDVLKELVPVELLTTYREWRLARTLSAHPPEWMWDSVPQDRMAILAGHFERLLSGIRASSAEPVLLTHTNRFMGVRSPMTGGDRRHLVNLMSRDYPRASAQVLVSVDSVANDVMRGIMRKHGAKVVEGEGRIPSTARYFADYAHFTDAGAEAMATIVSAGLLKFQGQRDSMPPPLRALWP